MEEVAMERRPLHKEFHVRVVDKVRHRRQHEGESPASGVTGDEHEGKSPASCGTGDKRATTSVPRRGACVEGIEGVALIEANGGDGNWCDKMAMAAVSVLHQRHQRARV
uniref:Uncharacterized protein n=1 Tax=Hordeum vulgare subsp. vulgare TaxID=112509 RepID=A0A8I6Y9T1_HORVV